MQKKQRAVACFGTALLFVAGLSAALTEGIAQDGLRLEKKAKAGDSYSLTFDKDANHAETFDGSGGGSVNVTTHDGNPLTFSYEKAAKYEAGFIELDEGGSFSNPYVGDSSTILWHNAVSGITGIKVNFTGSLTMYYGWGNDATEGKGSIPTGASLYEGGAITSGKEYTFDYPQPSYFLISNSGDETVEITSIILGYYCERSTALFSAPAFALNSDRTGYILTAVTGDDSSVTVPTWHMEAGDANYLPVTSIGDYAFSQAYILSVLLPDTITSIGDHAFDGCSLQEINIPDGVTSIGEGAFQNCYSLIAIDIPDTVTSIGANAFGGDSSLMIFCACEESGKPDGWVDGWNGGCPVIWSAIGNPIEADGIIYIPVSRGGQPCLAVIGAADSLTDMTIPEKVTVGGVDLPVKEIAASVLCENLISISIPAGVTSIGPSAFVGRHALTSVTFAAGSALESIGESAFQGCQGLASIAIPENVASIGDSAFRFCPALASVTFGAGSRLVSIGGEAFAECYALQSISIPESVTSIGKDAFRSCNSLTIYCTCAESEKPEGWVDGWNGGRPVIWSAHGTLVTVDGIKYLPSGGGDQTVYLTVTGLENPNETTVTIPETVDIDGVTYTVKEIAAEAFHWCYSLQLIVIPDSIVSIGDEAFEQCSSLQSIVIPKNVTAIGQGFLAGCSALTSMKVAEGNDKYKSYDDNCIVEEDTKTLIAGCGSPTIPADVTSIGAQALQDCSFTSISIPDNVTSIGDQAFTDCASLTSVTFGEGSKLVTIGDQAFAMCAFASISIPESVTSIGDQAFALCFNLTSINIPKNVDSIGEGVFSFCSFLSTITVDVDNDNYTSGPTDSNCIIEKSTKTLIAGCAGTSIPEDEQIVTSIGDGVFAECSSLKSIVIPAGITSIGNSTFSDCDSLASVTFAADSKLKSIGKSAFRYCSSLKSIAIPAGTISIGEESFESCQSLESIYIPASVTFIGQMAFSGCDSLTIYCECDEPDKPDGWVENWNGSRTVAWSSHYDEGCYYTLDNDENPTLYAVNADKDGKVVIPSKIGEHTITAIASDSQWWSNLTGDIYFNGTADQWSSIDKTENTNITVYFYSETTPTAGGSYWHYEDGVVTIWENS